MKSTGSTVMVDIVSEIQPFAERHDNLLSAWCLLASAGSKEVDDSTRPADDEVDPVRSMITWWQYF